ncbi:2'-5'-oligoadenylate synthase 2 isoform X3 [Bos mutus]|uniref:2'-5'-oligoadenylate synthase 2 isoform X3 n=1 Tax=Bos mutus TaxID=72004 RepID=UPI0038B64CD7
MGSRESHLYEKPSEKLEEFIQNHLRPSEDGQKDIDQSVDTICEVLQEPCPSLTVTGVARGGSYGRRTVLRGNSDGILVVFFGDLEQFQDQEKRQYELLSKIWAQMKHCESTWKLAAKMELQNTNRSSRVTIQLSTKQQSITFNVLPAFNALGLSEKSSLWSYRELKRSLDMVKARPGEFSVCFTELQEKFFSNYPSKLKDLILLVKHWFQKCQEKLINSSLLPPYALELLTIYAWEQGCGAEDFDMAEGVRTVLRLIEKQEQLCVYWTVNYNFGDETVRNILLSQLQAPRPVILDPTDPTNNVSMDNTCWLQLKHEAQNWLRSLRQNESPGPSWNVLPAPLYITPGHLLDKFVKDFLQPNQTFQDQIKKALKIICSFLEENCFRHSTTKIQVIQGGSTVKGTALKTGSDASLVVFANSLKSYTSPKNERYNIIKEIHEQLEACRQEKDFEVKFEISKWKPPWVLSFTLKSKVLNESVDFDVLPAFNALGELKSGSTPSPRTYTELIHLYKPSDVFLEGEFSVCFTKLQRNFVRSLPLKLKDLIRLLKHWYKGCEKKLKQKGSLPPKYALELLTIYAWEKGSGAQDFDMAEGFRTVLELVMQYQHLCVFWTVNYSFDDEILRNFLLGQIQRTRPVILDPADPTGDVGGGHRWCWHLLAKEATEWLSSLCFKDKSGCPIQPWNVPKKRVQTPGSCGAGIYSMVNEMHLLRSHRFLD